jgi:hypothetical protein
MVTVLKFLILSRLEDFTISYTRLTSLKKKKKPPFATTTITSSRKNNTYLLLFTFHFSLFTTECHINEMDNQNMHGDATRAGSPKQTNSRLSKITKSSLLFWVPPFWTDTLRATNNLKVGHRDCI